MNIKQIAKGVGLNPWRKLGAGCDGVVYSLKDRPGLVAKITVSQAEARVAAYLKRMADPPDCLPRVHEVHRVEYDWPTFAREDWMEFVSDLGNDQGWFPERNSKEGVFYVIVREDVGPLRIKRHQLRWFVNAYRMQVKREDISAKLNPQDRPLAYQMHDAITLLRQNDICPGDLHSDNWGLRDGKPVVRDFSRCIVDGDKRFRIPTTSLRRKNNG